MAIATADDLVNAMVTKGQNLPFHKERVTTAVSRWHSTWAHGGFPVAGATPTSGSGQTNSSSTLGAIPFTNPTGGDKTYLTRFALGPHSAVHAMLVDRLVTTSGLNGTLTSAQTVNSVALPTRGGTGEGVEAWLECYSPAGATTFNVTMSYTNTAGVAGRTTTAVLGFVGAQIAGAASPISSLQAGDTGIQSVQSVTFSASSGSAGNLGITLLRRVAFLGSSVAGTLMDSNVLDMGMPMIPDSACLSVMEYPSSATTTSTLLGQLMLAQG